MAESLSGFVRPRDDDASRAVFLALDDVSFTIYRGEKVGIIGRNGAGKSTLLKIISRVIYPSTGEVVIRGRLTSLLELGTGFNSEFSGRDNIYLNASLNGLSDAEIRSRYEAIVDFAELGPVIDLPVKQYSSGMQMRLAFAVAVHLDPDILILDEVLTVGDEGFQKKCFQRIEELMTADRTLLFVSHSIHSVQRVCERSLWLENGRIRSDGPTPVVVKEYLGSLMTDTPIFATEEAIQVPEDVHRAEVLADEPAPDHAEAEPDGHNGPVSDPPGPAEEVATPPDESAAAGPPPRRDWFGTDVGPLFDTSFYLEQNPDVAAAGLNPLTHYVTVGADLGRRPHPLLDASLHSVG